MPDLFAIADEAPDETIAPGAVLLCGFALPFVDEVLTALSGITAQAPFRHMTTPWGATMSVAMTNCGDAGWLTDPAGYRYDRIDPETGQPWPAMPECFRELASRAADRARNPGFVPDACLINRYAPGTRLTLHQDRDERDYGHPIVSVSLGLSATFQFGGPKRRDAVRSFVVRHGDVVVWGNDSRLAYHGIAELKYGQHPLLGKVRINLTFRRALRRGSTPSLDDTGQSGFAATPH